MCTWTCKSYHGLTSAAHIFLELLEVAKAIQHMHLLGIKLYTNPDGTIEGVRACSIWDPINDLTYAFVRMLLSSTQNPVLEFRAAVYSCGAAITTASKGMYKSLGSFFTR